MIVHKVTRAAVFIVSFVSRTSKSELSSSNGFHISMTEVSGHLGHTFCLHMVNLVKIVILVHEISNYVIICEISGPVIIQNQEPEANSTSITPLTQTSFCSCAWSLVLAENACVCEMPRIELTGDIWGCPYMPANKFSTPQHLMNLIHTYRS